MPAPPRETSATQYVTLVQSTTMPDAGIRDNLVEAAASAACWSLSCVRGSGSGLRIGAQPGARHRLAVHWLFISGSRTRYNLLIDLYYSSLARLTSI